MRIGSAALKATIEYTLEHRADYKGISILYGATAPQNFTYQYDIEEWQKRSDIDLTLTIDRDCDGWQCDVGLVPAVLERMHPDPTDTIAITCGPPIMIKFAQSAASASAAAATWGPSTCAWTARCSRWRSWRSCRTSCSVFGLRMICCFGGAEGRPSLLDLGHLQ